MLEICIDRCNFSFWRELMEFRSEKYEFICCIGDCLGEETFVYSFI